MVERSTFSFTMPVELMKSVDAIADAQNLSRSQLLEKWLREHLDEEKRNMAIMGDPVLMKALMGAFGNPDVMKAMAAAIENKLDDEQLELFHRGLSKVHLEAQKVVGSSVKKTNRRKGRK